MKFKSLIIKDLKQFNNIEIDFHDKLTILVGPNATGKTTLLNILAYAYSPERQYTSTPILKDGEVIYNARLTRSGIDYPSANCGELIYSDGHKAQLKITSPNEVLHKILVDNSKDIPGIYIPSYRPEFTYRRIDNVAAKGVNSEQAFLELRNTLNSRFSGGGLTTICTIIKSALISWAAHNQSTSNLKTSDKYDKYFSNFKEVLRLIMPSSIGYEDIFVAHGEIFIKTNSGNFILDAFSSGISSLLELIWPIFIFFLEADSDFIVLIDEVENHLHPGMQRTLLPHLITLFPKAQFIVTTHSPLIVSSVENSNIYILNHNSNLQVDSSKLDFVGKPRTASDILREVLDVPFTMPIWIEHHLDEITKKYSKQNLREKNTYIEMRNDLSKIGLEDLAPEAIIRILDSERQV